MTYLRFVYEALEESGQLGCFRAFVSLASGDITDVSCTLMLGRIVIYRNEATYHLVISPLSILGTSVLKHSLLNKGRVSSQVVQLKHKA